MKEWDEVKKDKELISKVEDLVNDAVAINWDGKSYPV